eukprot:TRINITY_DN1889_c0_g1_i1.p1 TRINITY_DN1889_c0_g1~~TRINITY_DN1889_c0_g1_i1.p1  ORF type:complete len:192 (-),score=41.38 TRINITY_DN1889_c0_g1_i1:387-962(-)
MEISCAGSGDDERERTNDDYSSIDSVLGKQAETYSQFCERLQVTPSAVIPAQHVSRPSTLATHEDTLLPGTADLVILPEEMELFSPSEDDATVSGPGRALESPKPPQLDNLVDDDDCVAYIPISRPQQGGRPVGRPVRLMAFTETPPTPETTDVEPFVLDTSIDYDAIRCTPKFSASDLKTDASLPSPASR